MNLLWDIPFFKINYLFAISKIFILHCQVTYLSGALNLDTGLNLSEAFSVFGNPHKILNGGIKCLNFLLDLNEDNKTFKYYVSIYGLFFSVGLLILIICIELTIYYWKILRKYSYNKMIHYV